MAAITMLVFLSVLASLINDADTVVSKTECEDSDGDTVDCTPGQ